jgi:hypothetical protein
MRHPFHPPHPNRHFIRTHSPVPMLDAGTTFAFFAPISIARFAHFSSFLGGTYVSFVVHGGTGILACHRKV